MRRGRAQDSRRLWSSCFNEPMRPCRPRRRRADPRNFSRESHSSAISHAPLTLGSRYLDALSRVSLFVVPGGTRADCKKRLSSRARSTVFLEISGALILLIGPIAYFYAIIRALNNTGRAAGEK
jgi:hypothetical protein